MKALSKHSTFSIFSPKSFMYSILGAYPTKNLRTPFKITMDLISKLYREEDATQFKESWVPMIHVVTLTKTILNWASILLAYMAQVISKAKYISPGMHLKFFMSYYILDIAYIVKIYIGMC